MSAERDYSDRRLIDKLGVKPEHRVSLVGVEDPMFLSDLDASGADISRRLRRASDQVFLAVEGRRGLGRIRSMEPSMTRPGALWVIYPKGRTDLREADVIEAGLAAGLVDNKVVRFSDTHTALRFVIPVARR